MTTAQHAKSNHSNYWSFVSEDLKKGNQV